MKTSAAGNSYAEFSVAFSKGKDDKKTTTWFRCMAMKGVEVDAMAVVKKGVALKVSGGLDLKVWKPKEGEPRIDATIFVAKVEVEEKKPEQDDFNFS